MITNLQSNLAKPIAMQSHKIAVVLFGEVLIDVFPDGNVLGGAPFNVARHLRALGLYPVLISRTGNDELRDNVIRTMTDFDMDTTGIQSDPLHPTGQVAVHIDENQHRFEILDNQAYDFIHPAISRLVGMSVQPELVYFGTLAQRHGVSRRALSALLRSLNRPSILDLNLRKPWYDTQILNRSLERADIVKMSNEELATLAKTLRLRGTNEKSQAAALIRKYQLDRVLVTCGKRGAWVIDREGMQAEDHSAGEAVELVDTVGAGDAFTAVFMVGTLLGWPTQRTLMRANRFAAAICGIRGAIPHNQDFYSPFLREWHLEDSMP
ncbi:MAG TPA: carbohydrate kinase [Methylophilaceae bacterium]|nr:carbohydrate kinase [Methylophilaceae bacterium]